MNKCVSVFVPLLALSALLASPVRAAETKPITRKDSVTVKATIMAIDHDTRVITFKDSEGEYEDVIAGPEVKRFDELKVGDKVTFKYSESVVLELRKPGEPAPPDSSGAPSVTRNPSSKPSGSVTHEETITVTVVAIDAKAGAATIRTEDGRTMSFLVEDKSKWKGVNPGDRVVITYTTGLLISVE